MKWPPDKADCPEGFTAYRDGWAKWYRGKTRHVAGKRIALDKLIEVWLLEVRPRIDAELAQTPAIVRGSGTYRDVLSRFLDYCEHRVKTGKPWPMKRRTYQNYVSILNDFGAFVGGGTPIVKVNRPEVFAEYAKRFADWQPSGFDSVVCRIGALFRWAQEAEIIDRYRPGPGFQRPAKAEIRDRRIDLSKVYKPADIAKLYLAANPVMRCWIGLGVGCAFTNSDVAHMTRDVIDLDSGVIDFRRRKTGKVRRIIPIPESVRLDLLAYKRPDAANPEHEDRFFLSRFGLPYTFSGSDDANPSNGISRMWAKLRESAGVGGVFTGLRTTFYNLAPGGEYEIERKIIMGRAQGTIDLDHYLETIHLIRLRHVVDTVWSHISTALADEAARLADGSSASSPAEQ